MAIRVIEFAIEVNEAVNSGDTLILMMPQRAFNLSTPTPICTLGVYPLAGSTTVTQSLTNPTKIRANPADLTINWSSPPILSTISPATAQKIDVFEGNLTAIRIQPIGGDCVIEGRY